MFHHLPENVRLRTVKSHLGPAAGWPMKQRLAGRVEVLTGRTVSEAKVRNGKVHLTITGADGGENTQISDRAIAATGYRVDLRKLRFLGETLRSGISEVENTPVLKSSFESSVPGLYFAGPAAANSFGPLLRFAFGSAFAARRLAEHLSKSPARVSVPGFGQQYKTRPL
jgi:thioredoxin reductase